MRRSARAGDADGLVDGLRLVERAEHEVRQYGGMNSALDRICAGYDAAQLELLAGFLADVTEAGRVATEELPG